MKFVLWGAIAFVVVMWLLRAKKSSLKPEGSEHKRNEDRSQRAVEGMVRCAQCGVHIPVSEAIVSQPEAAFCSEEHRLQHMAK